MHTRVFNGFFMAIKHYKHATRQKVRALKKKLKEKNDEQNQH